jgi:hypothetical protein
MLPSTVTVYVTFALKWSVACPAVVKAGGSV